MAAKTLVFNSFLMFITLWYNADGQLTFSPGTRSRHNGTALGSALSIDPEISSSPTDEWTTASSSVYCKWCNQPASLIDDTIASSSEGSGPTTGSGNVTPTLPQWFWQPITWSWWVILQMVTALLGIVGNLLVIIVLFQRRAKSRSTDTLIGALAAADLITSIFMIPLPAPLRVPPTLSGQIYCKVVYTSVLMWVSVDASIFTLTVIPIERYIAIVYPFQFKQLLTRRRVTICIVLIWFVGFMANFFIFFISRADPNTHYCIVAFPSRRMQLSTGWVLFFLQFVIPTVLTLVLQALTARSLHIQSRRYLGADKRVDRSNPSARHLIAKKRVLQMLFLVVLLFIICWGPSQIAYLAYNLGLLPDTYPYSPPNRTLVILSFCNSCANPIIYTTRYPEFRSAMKELFTLTKHTNAPLFEEKDSKLPPSSVNSQTP